MCYTSIHICLCGRYICGGQNWPFKNSFSISLTAKNCNSIHKMLVISKYN